MKILIKLFFILSFSTIITVNINGETITYEGMKFNLNNGVAELVKASEAYIPPSTIMIPDTIFYNSEAFPVTEIGDESMQNMNLNKLNIPNTIKKIGKNAFKNTTVRNLYIEDLSSWCNIDFEFESWDGTSGNHYSSQACPIGSSTVLYVDNKKIESLVIPDDVQAIPAFAFNYLNCRKVDTGNGVKTIGEKAFINCMMEEVKLGENVELIAQEALAGCKNLKKLTLLKSPRYMDYKSFDDDNITEIYAPDAEVLAFLDIPWDFYHWKNTIFGEDCTLYINGNEEPHIFIHASADRLGNYAYNGISNVVSIELEEGITSTGIFSFTFCNDLESLIFPSTLERVGSSFRDCPKLTSITVRSLVPPEPMDEIHTEFDYVGKDLKEQCTVYVPEESLELYKTDWFWSQFNNIQPISESGVESITDENLQDKVIYDLQGRKVSGENLAPGIYVIDGKKTVIR